jgi:nicotinamidase-related amidase
MKTALFLIDYQNDFCLPTGALSVPGAMDDIKRLCNFINKNGKKIDKIILTQDCHYPIHVGNTNMWIDKNGNKPSKANIPITLEDVRNGVWTPRYHPKIVIDYLEKLEISNGIINYAWNPHCLMGSEGAAVVNELMDSIIKWNVETLHFYDILVKGSFPFSEHFGIFKAAVEYPNQPDTQMNQDLINTLNQYDIVYTTGEAKNFCLSTSINQLLEFQNSDFLKKIVIFEDCTSNIQGGLEHIADHIWDKAKQLGVQFKNSTDITL